MIDKVHRHSLSPAIVLVALLGGLPHTALAVEEYPTGNYCIWRPGYEGPAIREMDIGPAAYVAQDARPGTLIAERLGVYLDGPYVAFRCKNHATTPLAKFDYVTEPLVQMAPAVPVVGPGFLGDPNRILQTNVPGVGAVIIMRDEFDGTTNQARFVPDTDTQVPFMSRWYHSHEAISEFGGSRFDVQLVKTGRIPAGAHQLDPSYTLFRGRLSTPALSGETLRFGLAGTIISTGCELPNDPVTPHPVDLGEFEAADLAGPGASTTPVPFKINISQCDAPPGGAIPQVHLRLSTTNGSLPIAPDQGTFTAGAGSTASGVGFQVLRQDGVTPIPLGMDVPMMALPSGDSFLALNARLINNGPTVTPGELKGALNFVLSYQ
ncbi:MULTISPECIES: fimbrial protein [unclassified Pseudomonas]|uniref:fimbrial protein n=1 Tax=unclassified Pseudomonas TaxID=196821 RepID=UPI000BD90B5F|nr:MULTISPECIES: fimbrial protein [unclassified Pseudomonas]PVZ16413.1 type 1 fimbria pilin [Pseudomonas sp. URIL14HWK12:I12]PVZ25731.1 type 1 fimbria pilin [Pseudomonas sp. URIL14HWK12:I10]PVZ36745.1 type 1 fimbria pilin [Pseudomonas sp. URIL14HWK12:I11]SNZ12698.1 Pilin (type 1 fimbria component protein) [Pseudomonas sp. URIL14HWK12:I9]